MRRFFLSIVPVRIVSVYTLSPKHNADDYHIKAVKFYNEKWDVNLWFY